MNLEAETLFLMKKYNITANKNYGQNFLIDENAVEEIIYSSEISKTDLVIEIGPGLGTLTSKLLEKAGKVICIELDSKMITVLNDRFSLYNNFELLHEDVLKVDLNSLIDLNLKKSNLIKCKVVANLPYYITTPIIMKLLEEKLHLASITVMVQKEVALRLTDVPGGKDCGAITYTIHYYSNPKMILNVPKSSFIPAPKVDSAVIKLDILENNNFNITNEKLFFQIIKYAFMQKRKTLLNSLTNSKIASKETLEKMLLSLNLNPSIRAERLSIEDFVNISNYLDTNNL